MPQTSLPLSSIVGVSVVISPAAVPGPSFNQALIVGPSARIPSVGANSRLRLYQTLAAMSSDGFTGTDPEFIAAEIYFGQTPAPTFLWVGRQDLSAIATVVVGGVAGTGYVIGDVLTVTQVSASGGQVKVTTVNGSGGVTGLAIIQGSQGTGYAIATNLATTGGTGTGAQVSITGVGETPLQSIQACRSANTQWYICQFVGTAVDADHQAIAAYIEGASPSSVYFLTNGSVGVLNNTTNNLFALLQAAKYRRSFMVYSTTQSGAFPNNIYAAAAPMGIAMGRNTGAAGSYFDIMFKLISGVGAEPLTPTQVNTICGANDRSSNGLNGNVVLSYNQGSYTWMQPATMASGEWFDEVLFLDVLVARMQVNGVNLLTSVPALPITNAGVVMMKNALAQACEQLKFIGFIAPSGFWNGVDIGTGAGAVNTGDSLPKGYYLYAPPVSSLSSGQRSARQLPPITALVLEAQSGHSLTVTINVQQ